jgi:hypothetical protein
MSERVQGISDGITEEVYAAGFRQYHAAAIVKEHTHIGAWLPETV